MAQLEVFGRVLLHPGKKPLAGADITLYDLDDPLSETYTAGHTGEIILKTKTDQAGFFRGVTKDWNDSRRTFHQPASSAGKGKSGRVTVKLVDKLILLIRIETAGRSMLTTYQLPTRASPESPAPTRKKKLPADQPSEADWIYEPIVVPWSEEN